jgi:membrane protease YdiL (CAAX protease family)
MIIPTKGDAMPIFYPLMGFLILASYLRVIPGMLPQEASLWLLYAAAAFVLGRHVVQLVGLDGLSALGAHTHYGWQRNIRLGLMLGFLVWTAMYGLSAVFGGFPLARDGGLEPFHFAGWLSQQLMPPLKEWQTDWSLVWQLLLQLFIVLLAALLYELLIRGYLYAQLRSKLSAPAFALISAGVCALEGGWLSGFEGWPILIQFTYGLTFGYLLHRTRTIWMNVGVHAGLTIASQCWLLVASEASGVPPQWPLATLLGAGCLFIAAAFMLTWCRINKAPSDDFGNI